MSNKTTHPDHNNFMALKKLLAAVICLTLLSACAAPPEPRKKRPADEDFYAKAMNKFEARNYFEAIPLFEELREKLPLSPYAVLAELRLGDCHYLKGEYIEAIHYFENFRRLHPSNREVPYSIFMTGMCHYRQILSPDRDQTFAKEAVEQFQLLIDLFPQSPYTGKALCKVTEAKMHIAEHEYFIILFYIKKGNYQGAIKRLNKIMKDYPHAIKKDKMLFSLGETTILAGNNKRGNKILKLLLKKFPASAFAAQARELLNKYPTPEGTALN